MNLGKKGILKYSHKLKKWIILFDDGSPFQCVDDYTWLDEINVDIKLFGYYRCCIIDLKFEEIRFIFTGFHLNRNYNYSVIFYGKIGPNDSAYYTFDYKEDQVPFDSKY